MPVDIILGTEFLLANACTLDYDQRYISINKQNFVSFSNNLKSTDEVIDDRLCDRISVIGTKDEALEDNKILKFYQRVNHQFSRIKKPSVNILIKKDIPEIHQKGYSIPYKFVERGKKEIQRLLKENIIEHSNSQYSSPAFFIKKKE